MRDPGLSLAIKAVGGVGALARGLGIAQPSISGWERVPAERVNAVEALSGVPRRVLRPDLFAGIEAEISRAGDIEMDEVDQARGRQYLLLAALLRSPPAADLLSSVAHIRGDASSLGLANIALAEVAKATTAEAAGAEYFSLFVGVGRGEIVPYGSYYLTGFLYDRPLARLREDLSRLGVARADGVFEPEDHIASELETMAGLALGSFDAPAEEQVQFFKRHLSPWGSRFFADLAIAPSARFYRAVADVGQQFLDIEAVAFGLPQ
jgi:TorA maturation chaperone TorD